MSEIKTIALLGQPNSGKSTLFNNLTGLHQRVGNWPGKTVEQAEGSFVFDGVTYRVVDLPGSYGLSANSEEEIVTRDYIQSGKADLVCILVDASQLERSLYMLADFVGIRIPVMLVLNMMDVAEAAGKKIDVAAIEKRLGVPVLGFSAAETERYPEFFKKMVSAIKTPVCLDSGSLREELVSGGELGEKTDDIISRIEAALGDFEYSVCKRIWIAEKLLEKDKLICGVVNEMLPFARKNAIDAILVRLPAKMRLMQSLIAKKGATAVFLLVKPSIAGFQRLCVNRRRPSPLRKSLASGTALPRTISRASSLHSESWSFR